MVINEILRDKCVIKLRLVLPCQIDCLRSTGGFRTNSSREGDPGFLSFILPLITVFFCRADDIRTET